MPARLLEIASGHDWRELCVVSSFLALLENSKLCLSALELWLVLAAGEAADAGAQLKPHHFLPAAKWGLVLAPTPSPCAQSCSVAWWLVPVPFTKHPSIYPRSFAPCLPPVSGAGHAALLLFQLGTRVGSVAGRNCQAFCLWLLKRGC